MVEAALALAIAAIGITFFGVILQWLAYRATIEQAQRAAQSAADMRVEIHDLVGELRGMTERMVEAQERQFNRMLDAFVTRPAAADEVADKTSESALALREVLARMGSLEGRLSEYPEVEKLGDELREIRRRVDAVADSADYAARLAAYASQPGRPVRPVVTYGMMHVGVEGFGRYVVDVVDLLGEVKSIADSGGRADRSKLAEWHRSKMVSQERAVEIALRDGLLSVESDGHGAEWLSLTERGRQVVEAIQGSLPG